MDHPTTERAARTSGRSVLNPWLSMLFLVLAGGGVLETSAQGLSVPPAPRYPEQGRLIVSLEGESTFNRPDGDNTLLKSRLFLLKNGRIILKEAEISLGGELDIGLSYRTDPKGLSLRVEQNRLRLGTLVVVLGNWRVDPYVALGLQTTPTESFIYLASGPRRVSKFWDPVTTTESAGATWGTTSSEFALSMRLGVAFEQVRAAKHTLRTDDPTTEGEVESYRESSGVEFAGETTWVIDSSGTLESRLALFGSFEDPEVWRVESENRLRVSVGSLLAFVWQLNLRHDVSQTLRTQFLSGMSVGVETSL